SDQDAGRNTAPNQPAPLRFLQIANDAAEEEERAENGEDVVTDVPALIQDRRRDQDEKRGGERAPPSEGAGSAEEGGESDHEDAEERGGVAAGGVGVAEEQEDQRLDVEEKRPVHQGIVPVAAAGLVDPGEIGVKTLVVVERLGAEVPETGEDG